MDVSVHWYVASDLCRLVRNQSTTILKRGGLCRNGTTQLGRRHRSRRGSGRGRDRTGVRSLVSREPANAVLTCISAAPRRASGAKLSGHFQGSQALRAPDAGPSEAPRLTVSTVPTPCCFL